MSICLRHFARCSVVSALMLLVMVAAAARCPRAPKAIIRAGRSGMIVGFAAGGGNDIFARIVGEKLSQILGQSVVVENRPGAGSRLAAEYVTQQPADGYTLLVGPAAPWRSRRRFIPI